MSNKYIYFTERKNNERVMSYKFKKFRQKLFFN